MIYDSYPLPGLMTRHKITLTDPLTGNFVDLPTPNIGDEAEFTKDAQIQYSINSEPWPLRRENSYHFLRYTIEKLTPGHKTFFALFIQYYIGRLLDLVDYDNKHWEVVIVNEAVTFKETMKDYFMTELQLIGKEA